MIAERWLPVDNRQLTIINHQSSIVNMRHHNWKFIWTITLIITFSGGNISANQQDPPPQRSELPPGPSMGELIVKWVDVAHKEISKKILGTAHHFDTFFGDERVEEEKQDTQIKVITSVKLTEDWKTEFSFPISINLALPHLENRLQIVAETLLKESEEAEGEAEDGDKDKIDITDISVSLRYKVLEKARQLVNLDGGAKLNPDKFDLDTIDPFVKFRIRGTSDFDPWALRLTQFIVWLKSEGVSAISRFDLERRIRNTILFRMTGKVIWSEEEEGVQLVQLFSFRKRLSNNRAIGLEFSGEGHTYPSAVMDTYKAKLTYRQRLYRNWAFIAVEPEAQFLREDHFKLNPAIVLNIEIRFGKF